MIFTKSQGLRFCEKGIAKKKMNGKSVKRVRFTIIKHSEPSECFL